MKKDFLTLIIPLTILSFFVVTKWWYALPVDAPDTMYSGFPLIYVGEGWHTSMSLQIFIIEMIIDFCFYLLVWIVIYFLFKKSKLKILISKTYRITLLIISFIVIILWGLILSISQPHYKISRDYDLKIIETGFNFFWDGNNRPTKNNK